MEKYLGIHLEPSDLIYFKSQKVATGWHNEFCCVMFLQYEFDSLREIFRFAVKDVVNREW